MVTNSLFKLRSLAEHPDLLGLTAAATNFFCQFGVPNELAESHAKEAIRVAALLAQQEQLYRPGMLPHLLLGLVTQQKEMIKLERLVGPLPALSFSTSNPASSSFKSIFFQQFDRTVSDIDLRTYQVPIPSLTLEEVASLYSQQGGSLDDTLRNAIQISFRQINRLLTPDDIDIAAQTLVVHFDWDPHLAEQAVVEAVKALAIMQHLDSTPAQGPDQGWHALIGNTKVFRKIADVGCPSHGTTAERQLKRSVTMSWAYSIVFGELPPVWGLDLWGNPTSLPIGAGDCYNCSQVQGMQL